MTTLEKHNILIRFGYTDYELAQLALENNLETINECVVLLYDKIIGT